MKKYSAYILSFIICALSLTGCTEEAVITGGAGADAQQNEQQIPYSSETAFIYAPDDTAAATVEPYPKTQHTVEEWKEWECIAERPDGCGENGAVTTVCSLPTAAENSDPTPADTTSPDPVNIAPANQNNALPTMTFSGFSAAGEYEYTIQNNTAFEWGYGLEPYFDKFDEEQGVWLPVQPITDITVIEIYCLLQPGGSSTYSLPIESYYGDLSAGSYRVGLLMRDQKTEIAEMVWSEFDIDTIECY